MRAFALLALALLAGCTDPMLFGGVVFSSDGVAVQPVLSGQIGGTTVSIQPD
ncbi:MAG: hypothetical protein JNN02_05645 [Tabrizicola sp.]|nr:hypothetical protein [Tabrizicola sp.]